MTRQFSFLMLLLCTVVYGQNQRFVYEYRFIPDSTEREQIKTEMMHLDVSPKRSTFYSYQAFKNDSLLKDQIAKMKAMDGIAAPISVKTAGGRALVKDEVTKTYPEFVTTLHAKVGVDRYAVTDARPMQWNILPQEEKVGQWQAQKATTEAFGRKWIAWFSTDIPLQDGPYKFRGLPGLIVKLQDDTGSHVFELKASQKIAATADNGRESSGQRETEISHERYKKLLADYRKDPNASLRQLMAGGNVKIRTSDGNTDIGKIMRDREQALQKKMEKDNNPIELDLLK